MKNASKKENTSFNKIKTIIISIIVSIISWIAIVNIVNPDVTENFHDIKIQVNGTSSLREKGLVMVNASKLPECSVKVRGKRKDIIDSIDKVYAVINISDITRQGKSTVPVIINSPSSINLENQKLTTVDVEIEPCYSKDVPIVIKNENTPKDKLVKSVTEKEAIRITGSKNDLEKISACLVTANISELTSDTNTMYPFTYLSTENESIAKPDTVHCGVATILVSHTVYEKKTAFANLITDEALKETFRTDIDIKRITEQSISYGTKNSLVAPFSINYLLNTEDIKEGVNEIAPIAEEIKDVYIPENQLILSFTAQKLLKEEISVNITTENIADGYIVANVITGGKYTLLGTKEELKNVKAIADLSGLIEGTHKVPLKFENTNIQAIEPAFTTVIIARKED